VVGYQAKSDLSRFKEFIEREGTPTGAWRGDVPRAPQAGSGETGAPQPSTTDPAHRGTAGPASQGTADSASQGGTSGPAGSQPPTGQPPLR
jgi:hypothetical protein